MSTLHLSPSKVLTYRDCEYRYYLQYVRRIQKTARAANLIFGGIVADVVHAVRKSMYNGSEVDPVSMFEQLWNRSTSTEIIEYSSTQSAESLLETGKKLMGLYPAIWKSAGFFPFVDESENMSAELRIDVDLGRNVVLRTKTDFVGMHMETGAIAVIDEKTPATPTDPDFALVSPQLTDYQLAVEAERHRFGLNRGVDHVGFLELIKRKVPVKKGVGPEVLPPVLVPARTQRELTARRKEILDVANDIRHGRFRKNQRQAHNTPCDMCDYKGLCWKGDSSGLVNRDGTPIQAQCLAA